MTDLNPIIADRFTEHLEVFGKTMEHMDTIQEIGYRCKAALENGNKILFCGNGGSAADSQHLAAELICRFKKERRSLAGIALTTDTSALTAIANDYDFESVFARQVEGLGRTGDVLIGISTSGKNLFKLGTYVILIRNRWIMINTTISQFLTKQLPNLKIAVVGDVMVDRYVFGDVSRISPEAPVPVNRVSKMKEVLGGAGNVASNLSNLDCKVYLGALAGNDDHGHLLKNLLDTDKIDTTGLITSDDRSTITKMRILGDRQQMMRLDFETITNLTNQEEQQLSVWLENLCKAGIDGIVVSDYGKGVCTPTLLKTIFGLAKEYGVQTIVDPKGADWSKYNGATCITPNVKELGECVGRTLENDDATIVEAAKSVLATVDLDYIVATRSAKGITVIAKDGRTWHNPATQQEVFDVSGAGDTVVSMMMTCLASGLSMRLALHIANGAAGIVVSKVGTYPIHRSELLDLWHSYKHSIQSKPLYTKEEMKELVSQWQSKGETVVFTNGCFDILHRGHITYLQEAAQLGDHLIIGLNSDASVRRLKGETRPIVSEADRAALLSALQCIDGVVLFEEDTPAELLAYLRPNTLVKGGDYKIEDIIGRESVDNVEVLSFKEGYSTSDIVGKIATMAKEGKL